MKARHLCRLIAALLPVVLPAVPWAWAAPVAPAGGGDLAARVAGGTSTAPAGAPALPAIVEGTGTVTAGPNGRWREYFNADGAELLAGNADGLWFRAGRFVWRYDVRARRVDVATPALPQADTPTRRSRPPCPCGAAPPTDRRSTSSSSSIPAAP